MPIERSFGIEDKKNIINRIGSWVIGVIGWITEMLGFKNKK